MGKKLDLRLADDCRSVYMRYAGTIAMVYMRGVMDGARLHYAIVSGELPYPPEGQEMLPFDKTTQAGWDFENASPRCPSHLLFPHVKGKVYYEVMATSKNYFLVFWARDFVPTKVLESPEYLVYCGLFKTHCWGKRSAQNPIGFRFSGNYSVHFCSNRGIATSLRSSQ